MSEENKKTLFAIHTVIDLIFKDEDCEDDLFMDSSSDEDYNCEVNYRNSIQNYFEEVVPKYTDSEFVTHFRIQRALFDVLAQKYSESDQYIALKKTISYTQEKHLAIFLWFAGHEACAFRDISDRFNVSISTVSLVIARVTSFLSALTDSAIRWPNATEKKESEEHFKARHGFPGVIGAIDGTHIIIDPPKRSKDDYLDRKNNYSICLQGICNEKRKFIDIFIGFPGSVHDSRVFKNSFIYPKLNSYCENYHILGDSAYPCSEFLLTPYRDNGHLTPAQINFNKCLSSQRVVIEHTFGILKQRFRQLYYCKLKGIDKICHFIRACCVLHNLAGDEIVPDADDSELIPEQISPSSSREDNSYGQRKRNEICRILNERR